MALASKLECRLGFGFEVPEGKVDSIGRLLLTQVEGERLDELNLPPMYANNEDPKQTAFTVSTDYKFGTTTGISAADRAATFRALADPSTKSSDLNRPGHVFPLRPKPVIIMQAPALH